MAVLLEGFGKVNYEDSYSTIDVDNEQMDISYSIGNLRERYTYWSVGVPVQLAWNYDRFTLYTGVKAVLPLTCSRCSVRSHPLCQACVRAVRSSTDTDCLT